MTELGEERSIPRRDVLQGVLVGAASLLTGSLLRVPLADAVVPATDLPGYYPPIRTGLRGSHPGSFEQAHALRDGERLGAVTDTGEMYDLVIVGGGISKESEKWVPRLTGIRARIVPATLLNDAGIVGAAMSTGSSGAPDTSGAAGRPSSAQS